MMAGSTEQRKARRTQTRSECGQLRRPAVLFGRAIMQDLDERGRHESSGRPSVSNVIRDLLERHRREIEKEANG
jgi:hypothetical protein